MPGGRGFKCMQVFMEEYNLGMCSSWLHQDVITVEWQLLLQETKSPRPGELQVVDESSTCKIRMNKYCLILFTFCRCLLEGLVNVLIIVTMLTLESGFFLLCLLECLVNVSIIVDHVHAGVRILSAMSPRVSSEWILEPGHIVSTHKLLLKWWYRVAEILYKYHHSTKLYQKIS